jgi:hypothetical protein
MIGDLVPAGEGSQHRLMIEIELTSQAVRKRGGGGWTPREKGNTGDEKTELR